MQLMRRSRQFLQKEAEMSRTSSFNPEQFKQKENKSPNSSAIPPLNMNRLSAANERQHKIAAMLQPGDTDLGVRIHRPSVSIDN